MLMTQPRYEIILIRAWTTPSLPSCTIVCAGGMFRTRQRIATKIRAAVFARHDFTFDGISDRNSNKLVLRESRLSINLTYS